jgi:hypothetical protein
MSVSPNDLLDEFRKEVKDKRRGAIIDVYIKKPSADAMSARALQMLAEDLDAIEKP